MMQHSLKARTPVPRDQYNPGMLQFRKNIFGLNSFNKKNTFYYNVQCTINCTVYHELYNVQCTMNCTVNHELYSLQCTMNCTMYSVP